MGSSPFANYCFQMGVTVMGFAEDFGHSLEIFLIFQQEQESLLICFLETQQLTLTQMLRRRNRKQENGKDRFNFK